MHLKLLLIAIWISHFLWFFVRPCRIAQFHHDEAIKSCITCTILSACHRSTRCVGRWFSNWFYIHVYSFCKWSTTIFFLWGHMKQKPHAWEIECFDYAKLQDFLCVWPYFELRYWKLGEGKFNHLVLQFLMIQYNDKRWIEHFLKNISFVRQLTKSLKHKMEKRNTKFKFAMHVGIKVTCSLYKLTHTFEYF